MHKKRYQIILNIFFLIVLLICIVPFFLMLSASLTDNMSLLKYGYSFFPKDFSLDSYVYLWREKEDILRAYGVSILVTIVGVLVGLSITALLAYPISKKNFPLRKGITFIVFFTMLFNGGLVPTYLVYVNMLDVKNSLLALILPKLLMTGFNVLLMKSFFTEIPSELLDAAAVDGAGELKTFLKIILPLSTPIFATIGLLQTITYWNDWYNGLIFVTNTKLYSVQNLLNRILMDAQYLAQNANNADIGATAIPLESARMAMAVVGILPLLLAYPFFQKYLVKGLCLGSVKG